MKINVRSNARMMNLNQSIIQMIFSAFSLSINKLILCRQRYYHDITKKFQM